MFDKTREEIVRLATTPVPEKGPQSGREIVRKLAPEIRAALDSGHSSEEIAEILERNEDYPLSPKTIRQYMREIERAAS